MWCTGVTLYYQFTWALLAPFVLFEHVTSRNDNHSTTLYGNIFLGLQVSDRAMTCGHEAEVIWFSLEVDCRCWPNWCPPPCQMIPFHLLCCALYRVTVYNRAPHHFSLAHHNHLATSTSQVNRVSHMRLLLPAS